jgi:hypothetical protein
MNTQEKGRGWGKLKILVPTLVKAKKNASNNYDMNSIIH